MVVIWARVALPWVGEIPGVTFHNARAAGPLEGGDGILTEIGHIRIGQDIGVLTDGHIIALGLGVAPQHGGKLLPGDGVVGTAQAVTLHIVVVVLVCGLLSLSTAAHKPRAGLWLLSFLVRRFAF